MSEQALREQLQASFKNRAILYYLIFDELRQDVGEERAVAVLLRAIYRRGAQIGEQFRQFAPDDLAGLQDAFLKIIPDSGRMFDPQVVRCDAQGLDIQLEACPLKQAWQELGLSEADVATMCRIAGEIDKGTFEAAGFAFEPDTWQPGRSGCCHLKIRKQDKRN
ncbi:MAG: L-2-amino-thiazoline-4-carboxylic acid hydrolase [Planctomycetota bacterium]|nr:L-2-amino-thiazoline-4-carboxylic acid hydrolase [Planctomycetota bacterium]